MSKIKVTRIRSSIGANQRQKANLEALGLHSTNSSRVHTVRPEILGMIKKVSHLIRVEELDSSGE